MKLVFPILALASLTGCAGQSTPPEPLAHVPVPPALTQSLASPCPPLSLLTDNSIGTLAIEDANAAVEYARCKHKASELVRVYNEIRQELIEFEAKQKATPDE